MPVVVVLSTFPNEAKAAEIGTVLVDERLCACMNIVPQIRSIYRYKDARCDEPETLAIMKTTRERAEQLIARLVALHPYEVPEAVVLPVDGGHAAYLDWVLTCSR